MVVVMVVREEGGEVVASGGERCVDLEELGSVSGGGELFCH